GSINWLQCMHGRGCNPWPVDTTVTSLIELDDVTMRAREPFPACPNCGALARPNILMFGDWQWNSWDSTRRRAQEQRLETWLRSTSVKRLAIIECGAGIAIPTVRCFSEDTAASTGARLIRINLREPDVPPGSIELALGAQQALEAMDRFLTGT